MSFRTLLDPLSEIMLNLSDDHNTNCIQILIVDGHIDALRLRRAIEVAVMEFPLLRARALPRFRSVQRDSWRPDQVVLEILSFDGSVGFSDREFRRFVASYSERCPVRWSESPPIRGALIQSSRNSLTAFVLLSAHAATDAQSDSALMNAILRAYGSGMGPHAFLSRGDDPYLPLSELFPGNAHSQRLKRTVMGLGRAVVHILATDLGHPKREGRSPARFADFYRWIVPFDWQVAVNDLKRVSGHTLNTLFSAALVRVVAHGTTGVARFQHRKTRILMPCNLRNVGHGSYAGIYRNLMVPCRLRVTATASTEELLREVSGEVEQWKRGGIFEEINCISMVNRLLRARATRRIGKALTHAIVGTTAAYSNPGIIAEDFSHFGTCAMPIIDYLSVGCMVYPLDFILYTPTINGRLELNAIYNGGAFHNFDNEVIIPLQTEIERLFTEYGIDYQALSLSHSATPIQ